MTKLIKLEWKKNNIGKYARIAIITAFILLIFIMIMAIESDADATIELTGKSMVHTAVDIFSHLTAIVFTSVMLSAFIVNAYENKTIHLMFLYPISRQKILISKMLAVWIFNFSALLLSKLFFYAVLLSTSTYTRISTANIQMGALSFWLDMILSSVTMVSISYIALLVGLKMKSSRAVIVAGIIIASFTQGNVGSYTLIGNIPFYLVLLILSFASVYFSVHRVETKDVI